MHISHNVIDGTKTETIAPFEVKHDDSIPFDSDEADLNTIVTVDDFGHFEGMATPRQLEAILDILNDASLL